MIQIELTQFDSNHDRLRSKRVVGKIDAMPEIGKRLHVWAEPCNPVMDGRLVDISPIVKLEKVNEGLYEFWTRNSHYGLCIIH